MDLPKIEKQGIALDIDETIAWTVGLWVEKLQKLFGNPENLSVNELVEKYSYTQNVPYWQTEEAILWMKKQRNSKKLQLDIPLIKDSNIIVKKINEDTPIVAYFTTRPNSIKKETKQWLDKYDFPDAPIICRPDNIPSEQRHKWKAEVLKKFYPTVKGIVDDDPRLIDFLPKDYQGYIFLYNQKEIKTELRVVLCKNWQEIQKQIRNNNI